MSLDDFIVTCFCLVDEMLPVITRGKPVRERGKKPTLSDSEAIAMEIVGSYLGESQDKVLFEYFRRHWSHFFPALLHVHRTTLVWQVANLWALKECLWRVLRDEMICYDPLVSIVDSVQLPVRRFAHTPWCVRFRGVASSGKDHADRQIFYGFRLHLQLGWSGLSTRVFLAPANEADGEIAPILLQSATGVVLGDRNYWLPDLQTFLWTKSIILQAPFRLVHSPKSKAYQSTVLGQVRYLIDTIFGQLANMFDETSLGAGFVASAQPLVALHFDAYGKIRLLTCNLLGWLLRNTCTSR